MIFKKQTFLDYKMTGFRHPRKSFKRNFSLLKELEEFFEGNTFG